jgi:hypothetical protein
MLLAVSHAKAHPLVLFGKTTKEIISLGEGYPTWSLPDFAGPQVSAADIGGHPRQRIWLPKSLLENLYAQFTLANPHGVEILSFEDADQFLLSTGISEEDMQALYDRGEILLDLMEHRGQPGLERLRAYLPQMFLADVGAGMLQDPVLDPRHAVDPGVDFQALWDERRHFRWSDTWRATCSQGPMP